MSDWCPEVVRLGKIKSLEGSDFLEITTVMDIYPTILKKGQYKEGDLVSWICYDSVVPDHETFAFLGCRELCDDDGNIIREAQLVGNIPEKRRTIKSKKIRGYYSEGLIVDAPEGFSEGDCIIEHFQLTKRVYPEEIDNTGRSGNEAGPTGVTMFKYDLEGLAKYGRCFEEGEDVVITEKLEGENCTILYANDRLWVRSRNLYKKECDGNYWWSIPRTMGLEEKLAAYPGLAFWGELYGGVSGWKYDCPVNSNVIQRKFRVFDIWDTNIKNKRFLEWSQVVEISEAVGLETVPVLYKGPWKSDQSLYEMSEGNSVIGTCVREGFVVRSIPEAWHPKLHRKIAKLKGKGYKLKKK